MGLLKDFSGRAVILITFVFALVFGSRIAEVANDQNTCLCAYDGFGYYMYLPYFFEHQSLNMDPSWAHEIQEKYCGDIPVYQLVNYEGEGPVNIYHMGLSFLQLPAYVVGDISARLFGYPTDGFSKPYHVAFLLNALLFIFLGLLYLRKLLRVFFADGITAIVLLTLFFASNLYFTFAHQYDLQHLYLFALNGAFLYHLISFTQSKRHRYLIFAAALLGLSSCIRPTQVLWGIIPLILLWSEFGLRSRAFWKSILLFPLLGILWNLPQIMYWQMVGGHPLILNLHTEDLVLQDPHLFDFLFSYKKGWLLYSPIFLAAFAGLIALYKRNRTFFWAAVLFTCTYIYVMSSWECWWYAASFGSRVMVDMYPLLAILLGMFLLQLSTNLKKWLGYSAIGLFAALNIFQTHQAEKGYLDLERMTAQHYWYIFGKANIQNFSGKHLEMDHHWADPNWITNARNLPSSTYELVEKMIYSSDSVMSSEPGQDLFVHRITVLDELASDETQIEVEVDCSTTDSTKSAFLQLGTFSKYNWYSWNSMEVSKGRSQNEIGKHSQLFALPNIRHSEDELQFYLHMEDGVELTVTGIRIKAHSLVRK